MPKKLVYQPLKWEKELREHEQSMKELGFMSAKVSLESSIKQEKAKDSSQRNYCKFYFYICLNYSIIADNLYLENRLDTHCLDYCYLCGMSGVFAYLFDTPELQKQRHVKETEQLVFDFVGALIMLYALDQPFPPCIQKLDHLYVKLFAGDFEGAGSLLLETGTEFDPQNPDKLYIGSLTRAVIQALIDKDEAAMKEALTARIRNYRKWPVGYSTFIDADSIAMIKLARQHGMDCGIDVIEIPKFFFDKEVCRIDTEKVKLPFFEDAVEELKKRGIDWTL